MSAVRFKEIPDAQARLLLDFAERKNIGKSLDIEGVEFNLDAIFLNSSGFWRSRGLSIYFRTGRSVVRISDHWSESKHHDRSRKLNCGPLGSHDAVWAIDNSSRAIGNDQC